MRSSEPRLAEMFFALGDETRLSVLARLRGGALTATALGAGARMSRQAIVRHLQVLDGAGLVTHERRGREVLYMPDARRLTEACAYLEMISAGWDRAIDRLRDMVEGQARSTTKKPRR
ncbi:MAG TPA: metalloregulator ArsR/SmtB family transcription factor [Steroidobacteraceae bacterium]|nr:metalloregulator ArsR/SmtB family transcription factor [Steroidobacteraceae bacterium]